MKREPANIRIRQKKLHFRAFSVWLIHSVAVTASPPEAMRILQTHCVDCHNPKKDKGGLLLTSRDALFKGSSNGEIVVSGDRAQSMLYLSLSPDADPHMPPKKQLSNEDIEILGNWIDAGVEWDDAAFVRHAREPVKYELVSLPEGFAPTFAFALSPDSTLYAIGRGNEVVIQDDEGEVARLGPVPELVRSLAWSPDGKTLIAGSFGELIQWETSAWKEQPRMALEATRITALCYSEDGRRLYVAAGNPQEVSKIRVYDASTMELLNTRNAHDDEIYTMVVQPGKQRLLSAGADRTIRVWDEATHHLIRIQEGHTDAVYALAFSPDGKWLASAGADTTLAMWEAESDVQEITIKGGSDVITGLSWLKDSKYVFAVNRRGVIQRAAPTDKSMRVYDSCDEHVYGLHLSADGKYFVAGGESGLVHRWATNGKHIEPGEAPIASRGKGLSFVHDVLPVFSKAGCVTSECHARKGGQNGFELSIFSFDPHADFYEVMTDGFGRRVMPADPANSLLLLKATGKVPHEGGERFSINSPFYRTVYEWISEGMRFQSENEPTLASISLEPNAVTGRKKQEVTFGVTATYSDGSTREVTELSQFELSDKDFAEIDEAGQLFLGERIGETMVIARFMGAVAIAPVTVPPEKRLPDEWYARLPQSNFIDDHAYRRFQALGLLPSPRCDDATFQRRVTLDIIGRLPTVEEVRRFAADTGRDKRKQLVDGLLDRPEYADYWANKWADLIRPNPDRAGVKSVYLLDLWLRQAFAENMRYDQFVRELLTATGSTHRHGPAVMFRDRRTAAELTTMFSQIFLGMRLECARCHHHPNEKWSQKDFYQLAAFFKDVKRKGTGISPPISGSPEYIYYAAGGVVKHPVTGEVMETVALDGKRIEVSDGQDPRIALANWMVDPVNPYVARAAVNRVWKGFFGRGFTNPVDDFRASNPVSDPALLNALAEDFVKHGFNFKHLIRTIVASELYQCVSEPNETNLHDISHFSRSYRRRLPAEVLADMVGDVTGVPLKFEGTPEGSRAMQTWNFKMKSEFLDAFGRPDISADPPCERDRDTTLVQALHLMHSSYIQSLIGRDHGVAHKLSDSNDSNDQLVERLYQRIYSRLPSEEERRIAVAVFNQHGISRRHATEDLMWALMNTAEFVFNH